VLPREGERQVYWPWTLQFVALRKRAPTGRKRKSSRASPAAHAWIWAIATKSSTVLAAVDGTAGAYARLGAGDWQLALAFVSGRRAVVVAPDRAGQASSCRGRTIGAPQHSRRSPVEQDFRSGGEHQLDVGRSAVPPLVQRGRDPSSGRGRPLGHETSSALRLLISVDRASSKRQRGPVDVLTFEELKVFLAALR